MKTHSLETDLSDLHHMRHYAIWYHLHNLKNVKNAHGGVLRLVYNTPLLMFFTFLKFTNGTKLRNGSHMLYTMLKTRNLNQKSRNLFPEM